MYAGVSVPVLVLVLVLVALSVVTAHVQPTNVKGITIVPSDKREAEGYSVSTSLPSGNSVSCSFKFRTATPEEVAREAAEAAKPVVASPVVKVGPAAVDFAVAFGRLAGTCVTKKIDYWEYELCFGGAVRQIHAPDTYTLGATGKLEGVKLEYRDGLACDALANKPPRSVSVTFACDRNAQSPNIARVAEVTTCAYSILVGSSLFCSPTNPNDPRFEDITTSNFAANAQSFATNADPSAEDWFLELTPLSDGRAMCSVYSLEPRSTGSKLHFKHFDFSASRSGGSTPAVPSVEGRSFTARHPGRSDCADGEVQFVATSNAATLKNSGSFTGKLAYLKIYV